MKLLISAHTLLCAGRLYSPFQARIQSLPEEMEIELNSWSRESSSESQLPPNLERLEPALALTRSGQSPLEASSADAEGRTRASDLAHEPTTAIVTDPPWPPPFYLLRVLANNDTNDPQSRMNSKDKVKISKMIAFIQRKSTKEKRKAHEQEMKPNKLKRKQALSQFLKGVPGDDLDIPASASDPCSSSGMGLRLHDAAKNRLTARKEILPLTTLELAGFRLLPGPLTSGTGTAPDRAENLEESSLLSPSLPTQQSVTAAKKETSNN